MSETKGMALLIKRIGANSELSRDIDTVPSFTALNGTVTTSGTDATVLNYTGTTNWQSIFNLPLSPAVPASYPVAGPVAAKETSWQIRNSPVWIYVPGADVELARVIGLSLGGAENAFEYTLQLDRAMAGVNAAACDYVFANLLSYNWVNDGGSPGTIDGVSIISGNTDGVAQLAPAGTRIVFQDPVVIDATGTSVLVQEIS